MSKDASITFDVPENDPLGRVHETLDAITELLMELQDETAGKRHQRLLAEQRAQRLMADFDRRLMDADALRDSIQCVEARLRPFEAKSPPVLEDGKVPPRAQMSRLRCLIFHSANLSSKERKSGKAECSLRFSIGIGGRRAKPEINVGLLPPDQFYDAVMQRSDAPADLKAAAEAMQQVPGALAASSPAP